MQLLQAIQINGSQGSVPMDGGPSFDQFKILVAGQLSAKKADQRFFIRFNQAAKGYNSVVSMTGEATTSEQDTTGLYLGRNGWGLDCSLTIEYTLSRIQATNQVLGQGLASLLLSDGRFLGYRCNGAFDAKKSPLISLELVCGSGQFKGAMKLYSL